MVGYISQCLVSAECIPGILDRLNCSTFNLHCSYSIMIPELHLRGKCSIRLGVIRLSPGVAKPALILLHAHVTQTFIR